MTPGTRVRVAACSGIDSNKTGTIIRPGRTDGRGVPMLEGEYNPIQYRGPLARRWVQLDEGRVITMFTRRLEVTQ